jgi:HAD superfamily hydrolase (TIGR01549 family)
VTNISFDLFNTLVYYPDIYLEHQNILHSKRVAFLVECTGQSAEDVSTALKYRSPEEAANSTGSTIGLSLQQRTLHILKQLGCAESMVKPIAQHLSELTLEFPPLIVPRVPNVLRQLSDYAPLVIISNNRWCTGDTLRQLLSEQHLHLSRFFANLVFSDEIGWAKPSPYIFAAAWSTLGILPQDTLHIGDRACCDVRGAQAYGGKSVVCRVVRQMRESGDCSADGIFYDYAGLPALLQVLNYNHLPRGWSLVAEGLPVWGRLVVGRVHKVTLPINNAPNGMVVVIENSSPDLVPLFQTAAAILTEAGGNKSYAAQTARSLNIPYIIGLTGILERLRDNQLVLVDAECGQVFASDYG